MTKGLAAGIAVGSLVIVAAVTGFEQSDKVKGFEVPRFEADTTWPKLPNGWKLGVTSSIAVDRHDHVWILQRPRLEHHPSDAPPVLEIDEDGNYVQGWGGPADGYDWPYSEHGIAVDDNDNVWITGNNPYAGTGSDSSDDMLLKFTKTGSSFSRSVAETSARATPIQRAFTRPRISLPTRTRFLCLTDTATAGSSCLTRTRGHSNACGARSEIRRWTIHLRRT